VILYRLSDDKTRKIIHGLYFFRFTTTKTIYLHPDNLYGEGERGRAAAGLHMKAEESPPTIKHERREGVRRESWLWYRNDTVP